MGRWLFCIVDLQGELGVVGGGDVCRNVPVGCFDFVRWWGHAVKQYKQLRGFVLSGSLQVYAPHSPRHSAPSSGGTVMAEGVSRSVIAKLEQTISQEDSLLVLLKLSLTPCCAYKNLCVVLYKLLPERSGTQVKILSLSPGSDITCTTCIWKSFTAGVCLWEHGNIFHHTESFRSIEAACWYSVSGIDRFHLCDRLHFVCPHPHTQTHRCKACECDDYVVYGVVRWAYKGKWCGLPGPHSLINVEGEQRLLGRTSSLHSRIYITEWEGDK